VTSDPGEPESSVDRVGLGSLLDVIQQVAATDMPVLIIGERGVEDDRIARLIHDLSARRGRPFVRIDCSLTPPRRLQAELFGARRWRTRGSRRRAGRISNAEGGTVFLADLDAMPLRVQGQLLETFQGPTAPNVRLIAAIHGGGPGRRRGHIRDDLFALLSAARIEVPPLRHRQAEMPELARHLAERFAVRHGRPIPTLSPQVMTLLREHSWPGNLAELEQVIERMVVLGADHLGADLEASRSDAARQLRNINFGGTA
jgi:DNA-binding NtrC family response regulator